MVTGEHCRKTVQEVGLRLDTDTGLLGCGYGGERRHLQVWLKEQGRAFGWKQSRVGLRIGQSLDWR